MHEHLSHVQTTLPTQPELFPVDERTVTVQCTGCESECEVVVRLQAGAIIEVGGNNCPTGAIYARAQCQAALHR